MKRIFIIFISILAFQKANAQVSTASPDQNAGGNTMGNLGNFNFNGGGRNMSTDSLGRIQSDWDDTPANVVFRTTYSDVARKLDSTIHHFQKRNTNYPYWSRNLGNDRSAAYNLFFTPNTRIGMQSGFVAYDLYMKPIDSMRFYKSDKPYSEFDFMLGPKRQQEVGILHTQSPNDNFSIAGFIDGGISQGYYNRQSTRNMLLGLNVGYDSKNQRYNLKAGLQYQRYMQDENGGIASEDYLSNDRYKNNVQLIPVLFDNNRFSNTRSSTSNTLSNMSVFLHHQYAAVGTRDTLYNEDSTAITPIFTPRFTIMHKMDANFQRHMYKDKNVVDSVYQNVYGFWGLVPVGDSVYTQQNWNTVDNKLALGTSLGKFEQTASIEAGIGARLDHFSYIQLEDTANATLGHHRDNYFQTYVYGKILKEAYHEKQWFYDVDAQLFLTGVTAGNFNVNARIGKIIASKFLLQAGAQQALSAAPYYSQHFVSNKYSYFTTLDNQNVTSVWGNIALPKYKASIAVKNQILANYIYYDKNLALQQASDVYNILQVNARKDFEWGKFRMYNEAIWQQIPEQAPINIPELMLRHQIGIESPMFKSKLIVAAGLEVFYHSNYKGAGYSPFINNFYYQNDYVIKNKPEVNAYFNFRVKTFRAFIRLDQLQSLVWTKNIYALGYASQGFGFRFGFNWRLSN